MYESLGTKYFPSVEYALTKDIPERTVDYGQGVTLSFIKPGMRFIKRQYQKIIDY